MNRLTKYVFLFFVILFLISCITDVEEEYRAVPFKTIEEITANFEKEGYPRVEIDSTFPIVGWAGIPSKETKVERFIEMADAGFNINYTQYPNVDSLQKALDIADLVGMKIIIRCPELYTDTKNIVLRFKDHPANGGYFLRDEPFYDDFSLLANYVKTIESLDSNNFCYINILPNVSDPQLYSYDDYNNYVNTFLNQVPVNVLSFDQYPIVGNSVRVPWYMNLEIIRQNSLQYKIPFWAFALATAHGEYPIPTLSHLRLQVYSNLAYGAKGIQYFTYWTYNSPNWDFNNAPIEKDGSKTQVYSLVRQMNQEIESYSKIFNNSVTSKVTHYGDIPPGTKKFDVAPYYINRILINNGNALLAELGDKENLYFMIQNTNLNREIQLNVQADSETKVILKDGTVIPANLIKEEFKLLPGDMVLYSRRTN